MEDTAAIILLEEDNTDQYIHSDILTKNIETTNDDIEVLLPNKGTMKLTYTCNQDIPKLSRKSTKAHIFRELAPG